MFKALDHALWSVQDGEVLVPFVMTETVLTRFANETVDKGKEEAEKFLAQQTDEVITLAFDGFLTRDSQKMDAIFVEAFDKELPQGLLLAQRYKPKTDSQEFEMVGNPAVVEYLNNPIFRN